MKKFNEVMLEKRRELGMTRYRLYKLTGITQQTLLRMERNTENTIELGNALKIAKVLDIDLNIFKKEWFDESRYCDFKFIWKEE